jgi:hypothetical protein
MSKFAKCDACGEIDDWGGENGPFLENGAVVNLRTDNGAEEPLCTVEICPACKDKLFKLFPNIEVIFNQPH